MTVLAGKHVVVVGGASGMGEAIARKALEAGARVTIAGSSQARLAAAAKRLGTGAATLVLDLADAGSIAAAGRAIPALDHLLITAQSRAAVQTIRPLAELDFDLLRQAFEVKLFGALRLVRELAGALARDGSITFFSGGASRRIIPGHVGLAAVNAAIEAAARQLARELAPVRVNVISPGLVRTGAYDAMPEAQREAMFAARARALPVGRVGEPEDIALAALHLMTNGYVSGAVQDVDGGGLLG
ncbi:MAG: SDR family oxidoreductase [Alphaproteobacteria bacterium]|nr:SDR family oxidoreductase [Alphaproteobacteria bacterium]